MISLQVGDCWLWSLIFQIQRYCSVLFVPQVYYTLIPLSLVFGGRAHEKKIWDVCWPIVMRTHGIGLTVVIYHGIFPL